MKHKFSRPILTVIALIIALIVVLATLIHGNTTEISIFHGFILHPVFILSGLSLFAIVIEE